MEGSQEMEVRVIARELVKPSSPTPLHLKNFTLSYVDQIVPISPLLQTPAILFYTATSQTQQQPPDIACLKTCLSQTLTKFYPLAGPIKQFTIDCNDEGLPFFETQVNCPLSTVLNSHDFLKGNHILHKFFPPPEPLAHFCFQINVFTCGGVAIALYDTHKLADGVSTVTFLKHWASLASRSYDESNLIQPDFGAAITASSPSPVAQALLFENGDDQEKQKHCSVVVKSFIFRDAALRKLKLRAASKQVLYPSRILALTGFIWEQVLASKACQPQPNEKTAFVPILNMRPCMNPPLPEASMGNLLMHTVASAQVKATLPELVASIHATISEKTGEIKHYEGEKGVKAVRENAEKFLKTYSECKDMAYGISSWCNLGLYDLDFGFGKPKRVLPYDGKPTPFKRNFVFLNDYTDANGTGIEAWLFLEEKEMQNLESSPQFLDFASPTSHAWKLSIGSTSPFPSRFRHVSVLETWQKRFRNSNQLMRVC